MEILVAHLDSKNRLKRFLENSSILVRVAIYFLVPREEFKTEKISHPTNHIKKIFRSLHFSLESNLLYPNASFLYSNYVWKNWIAVDSISAGCVYLYCTLCTTNCSKKVETNIIKKRLRKFFCGLSVFSCTSNFD